MLLTIYITYKRCIHWNHINCSILFTQLNLLSIKSLTDDDALPITSMQSIYAPSLLQWYRPMTIMFACVAHSPSFDCGFVSVWESKLLSSFTLNSQFFQVSDTDCLNFLFSGFSHSVIMWIWHVPLFVLFPHHVCQVY